jgi:hypothetical protein
MESKVLEAFLKQNNINDEDADERDLRISKEMQNNYERGIREMNKSQKIEDYIYIPTRHPSIEEKREENTKTNGTEIRRKTE